MFSVCCPSETELVAPRPTEQSSSGSGSRVGAAISREQRNECYRMAYLYLKDLANRRFCRVFTK
jgi:hypothetical protein